MMFSRLMVIFFGIFLVGCSSIVVPSDDDMKEFEKGSDLYSENCASCHGDALQGTDIGPPLIWDLYVTRHHSNKSFRRAIIEGVRQHHWEFGDMPAISNVNILEADAIVTFVRQTLRENGIY